ncbi:amidohydrolase [candidate division KSB1 bacterium]
MKSADLIVLNGKIWTGVPAKPWAEAFASSGSVITHVGTTEEIRALQAAVTTVFDAERRLVTPGFTDSHLHFMIGGLALLEADLHGVTDRQHFETVIEQKHRELPASEWMLGRGWDNSRWPDSEFPDRTWIDRVCPDRPVYLVRQDMHMALANGLALEKAGISRNTPDPDGGRIDRIEKTGEPSGILREAAMRLAEDVIPPYNKALLQRAIDAGCAKARKTGITSVHDITKLDDIEAIAAASEHESFTLHYRSFPPIRFREQIEDMQKSLVTDGNKFRIAGLKAFTDGSLGSRTALFFEPYTDAPGEYGLPNDIMFPEGNLLRVATAADRAGFQLIIHAIGDRANAELLDMYEEIHKVNGDRDRRWRIEHAQHIRFEDVRRFKNLGVTSSMQPHHCVDDARWAETRIGAERCGAAYAFRTFLDSGTAVVFGSDWTVAPLNPLLGISAAVNRIPLGGTEPWHPEQRITVEDALRAYTVTPAWSVFDENVCGTIEPGKHADCVILSDNIFEIPTEEIPKTSVAGTVFGGKVVYREES